MIQVRQVQLIEHGRAGHHLVPAHYGAADLSRVAEQDFFFKVDRLLDILHVEPAQVLLDEEGRNQSDEGQEKP